MDLAFGSNMQNGCDLKSYNDLSDDSVVRTGNNLNNAKICSNLRKLQIEENFGIQRESDSDRCAEDDCNGNNSSSSYDSEDMQHKPCEGDNFCRFCNVKYRSHSRLKKHQKHRNHFSCSVCEKVFLSSSSFDTHRHEYKHYSDEDEDEDDDDFGEKNVGTEDEVFSHCAKLERLV